MATNKKLNALALEIAKSQIGAHEVKENSGPEVDKYLKSVGLNPGYSWCMAFVYWCYDQAAKQLGIPNPLLKTGGVLKQWSATSDDHKITIGQALKIDASSLTDCIFIMDFGGGLGHTGIVERGYGGTIETIEGNTNDDGSREGVKVCRRTRKVAAMKGFIDFNNLT